MKIGFQSRMPYCLLIMMLISSFCRAADGASTQDTNKVPADIVKMPANFRQSATGGYRYQETRTLELINAPWHGAGLLFSEADGTLIKLQLSPERIIMAITATHMYYYHAAAGRRYAAPLDLSAPMVAQIGAFRALLQGRAEELDANYDVGVERHGGRWILHMSGKTPDNTGLMLEASGDEAKAQRKIIMRQADGEKTEYLIEPASAPQLSGLSAARLLAEAAGE
jgi:hypothetical protein